MITVYGGVDTLHHIGDIVQVALKRLIVGSHEWKNGKCDVCGRICEHETYVSGHNTVAHWEECLVCGKTKSLSFGAHDGGTHANGGICTICNAQYQDHTDFIDFGYKYTDTTHTPIYRCTVSGCTEEKEATNETAPHTFTSASACADNGDGTHSFRCTVCKKYGGTEAHTYVAGVCISCGAVDGGTTCDHEIVTTYEFGTNLYHRKIETCSKCGNEISNMIQSHDGGTHANGGICSICNRNYQDHTQYLLSDPWDYETTETEHTPTYVCAYSNCYETRTATEESEAHTFVGTYQDKGNGTHSIKCSICEYEKIENHKGATHDNEGKCTDCNAVYQNHGQSTTIKEFQKTSTTHTPIYGCNEIGCTSTYMGSAQSHSVTSWVNADDSNHTGNCEICGYTITESHDYENGTCKVCGRADTTPTACQHTYVVRNNGTQHWEECSKCNDIKANSLENHNVTTWTDNGNGKHSGNCTVCNYNIIENHTNGTTADCSKCSYVANNGNNTGNGGSNGGSNTGNTGSNGSNGGSNTGNTGSNGSNGGSNTGNTGSNGSNGGNNAGNTGSNGSNGGNNTGSTGSNGSNGGSNTGNTGSNGSNSGNNAATGKLPQTGANEVGIIAGIVAFMGISTIAVFRMKKYKDVK